MHGDRRAREHRYVSADFRVPDPPTSTSPTEIDIVTRQDGHITGGVTDEEVSGESIVRVVHLHVDVARVHLQRAVEGVGAIHVETVDVQSSECHSRSRSCGCFRQYRPSRRSIPPEPMSTAVLTIIVVWKLLLMMPL